MRWPESVLVEDEEVVAHVHPHWSRVVKPVAGLLVLVGVASFAAGAVPAGPQQVTIRLVTATVAAVLALLTVVRPLLRWAGTHCVLTTHRVLLRWGVLARDERAVPLARVVEVTVHRTPGQRLLGSGTVVMTSAGQGTTTVVEQVPHAERFRRLLDDQLDASHDDAHDGVDEAPVQAWTGGVADGWGSRVR